MPRCGCDESQVIGQAHYHCAKCGVANLDLSAHTAHVETCADLPAGLVSALRNLSPAQLEKLRGQ